MAFRSPLAFWLGGAASNPAVPPIPEVPGGAAGWGQVSLKHVEIQLRQELFGDFTEKKQAAILGAITWCLK